MEECERCQELLSARLDQELTPEEQRWLEQHLAECQSCRDLAGQLDQVHEALTKLGETPAPEGFAQGVMERVAQGRGAPVTPVPTAARLRRWGGLAACAVLCIGIYGLLQWGGSISGAGGAAPDYTGGTAYSSGQTAQTRDLPETAGADGTAAAAFPADEGAQQENVQNGIQGSGGAAAEDTIGGENQQNQDTQKTDGEQALSDGSAGLVPETYDSGSSGTDGTDQTAQEQQPTGESMVLTLDSLPQEISQLLPSQEDWQQDGETGTVACSVSREVFQELERLARELDVLVSVEDTQRLGCGLYVVWPAGQP